MKREERRKIKGGDREKRKRKRKWRKGTKGRKRRRTHLLVYRRFWKGKKREFILTE